MTVPSLLLRARTRCRSTLSQLLYRRPARMLNTDPLISFTFDDFPRSALHIGGEILKSYGFKGTYYAAFSLLGRDSPVGPIFVESDLASLLADGHELGCHTFAHSNAWITPVHAFEKSLLDNR